MEKYEDNQTAKGLKVGTIVADWFDEGVRAIIMRGPASFCVYLGIAENHPLAGFSYDDVPVEAHGGLTFSAKGGEKYKKGHHKKGEFTPWPIGFWWYGYDYAHLGDKTDFDYPPKVQKEMDKFKDNHLDEHNWTIGEIKKDSWSAIYSFKKLIKLSEEICKKAK